MEKQIHAHIPELGNINLGNIESVGIPHVSHAFAWPGSGDSDIGNRLKGKITFSTEVLNKETKEMALAYVAACEKHGI